MFQYPAVGKKPNGWQCSYFLTLLQNYSDSEKLEESGPCPWKFCLQSANIVNILKYDIYLRLLELRSSSFYEGLIYPTFSIFVETAPHWGSLEWAYPVSATTHRPSNSLNSLLIREKFQKPFLNNIST